MAPTCQKCENSEKFWKIREKSGDPLEQLKGPKGPVGRLKCWKWENSEKSGDPLEPI